MMSLVALFNRLIPFASPGTPLLQDVLHLVSLCALLYFAPHIQHRLQGNEPSTIEPGNAVYAVGEVNDAQIDRVQDDEHEVPQPAPGHPPRQQQNLGGDAVPVADFPAHEGPDTGAPDAIRNVPQAAQDAARQSNIGTKKAKSLARKDQRRAYHEHMRAQGDSQRARDAEGAAEREAALAVERERRRLAESQLEAQKAANREAKRRKDEIAREESTKRIDFVLQSVREELNAHRMCDLFRISRAAGDDVDEEWVEQVLKASGMIGLQGETMTMITQTGWVARVNSKDMLGVYHSIAMDNGVHDVGRVTDESLAKSLTTSLKEQVAMSTT